MIAFVFLSLGCGSKQEANPAGTAATSPAVPNHQQPPSPEPAAAVDPVSESRPTNSSASTAAKETTDPALKLELIATIQDPVVDGNVTELIVGSKCLAFAPGHIFAAASPLAIWKVGHEKPLWKPAGFVEVEVLAFSADGSLLALGYGDGTVSLWDVKAEDEKHKLQVDEQSVKSLAFSPNGKLLVTSGYDSQLKLWDVDSGEKVRSIPVPQESQDRALHVAISADGNTLVSAGVIDKTVRLWDVATGESKGELNEKEQEPRLVGARSATFSPDGKFVATADTTLEIENAVMLWTVGTRKLQAVLRHETGVESVAFSADSQLLASLDMEYKVRIWRVADHKLVQTLEPPDSQQVNGVAWSPDGKHLAAVGDDKDGMSTIWLWQIGPPDGKKASQPKADARAATPAREVEVAARPATPSTDADGPSKPATVEEIVQAIDLTKLPRLEGAKVNSPRPHRVSYSASGTLAAAAALYRSELTDLGWTAEKHEIPGLDPQKHAAALFHRAGFRLIVIVSQSDMPGMVNVSVSNQGNVDPRQLPRPAEATTKSETRDSVTFTTSAATDSVTEFCRKEFVALGWKETPDPNAEFLKKQGRTILRFQLHAMELTVVITVEEGNTTVAYYALVSEEAFESAQLKTIQAQDSPQPATLADAIRVIDLRTFPRWDGAKVLDALSHNLNYDAPGSLDETTNFYRENLAEHGWREDKAASLELETSVMLHFKKDGFLLYLQVSKSKQEGHVSVSLNNRGNVDVRQFPLVPNSKIHADAQHFNINYWTTTTRETAADFYHKELSQRGWNEVTGSGGSKTTEYGTVLKFVQNAIRLSIEIGTRADSTSVKIGSHVEGEAEASTKLDTKSQPPKSRPAAAENSTAKVEIAQAENPKPLPARKGLLVRDLPIPDGATDITSMKRRGDIRFQVTSDFKATGNFYAKKLGEQRWTKSGKDNLQQNFWVQTFSKDKLSLEVRVASQDGGSEVRLTPKGLMWDEDDQPSPKDLPIPKDATGVEYEDFVEWIKFKSPSNVKTVADFLSKELAERKWTKAPTEFDFANFVRLEFTQEKSSLEIDVRADDTGSEVWMRTKGMNWDGVKEENERAKKTSKDVATKVPPKTEREDQPAPQPKRKDKPKQGIAKLPKLPSEGTVTMDGKTFKLTSVIAYEVFSGDRWSTKIVATQKPIKQEALLAKLKKPDNVEGDGLNLPQPHLQVELDDEDRPVRLNLQADKTPGGGSSDELSGTALVEDGRARGTVKLKEPGSFFDKVYTAEISFDVPVLTRDSTPAKRLTDAPKLANSGTLTMGNKTYKLPNVVAYEMKRFDDPVTAVVFSEKPLNMVKLKAAVGKESIDDYFEFTPQVKLIIDAEDNLSSISIWADNVSVGGNDDLAGDVVIEDGRARGTAKMTKPGEFFDKKYTFDLSFDVDVLAKPTSAAKKSDSPAGGLVADSYDGLPIPEGYKDLNQEGSKFRKQTNASVTAELNAVIDFYRRELASDDWKENAADTKIEKQTAKLAFTGPTGSLTVQLKAEDKQTAITLVSRDAQAAKAAGLLPSPGKGRLIVANDSQKAVVVTINKRDYNVAAGAGAKDPKTGQNWDVAPGKYTVEIKLAGEEVQTEKLTIGADETWGVIIAPTGGYLAVQLY